MTRGLMGNWTFDIQDDFTLPDGTERAVYQTDDLENLHKDFAMKCRFISLKLKLKILEIIMCISLQNINSILL